MEQLLHITTSKPLNTGKPDKSAKTVPDDCYQYPKKPAKTSKLKDQHKTLIHATNRFSVLSPDENTTDSIARYDNLNEKATRVNKCLKKECEARNICFIDHRNISPKHNCNRSGLHSNYSRTKKLNSLHEQRLNHPKNICIYIYRTT